MKIINKGNKKAEILIYEEIGEGWFGGMTAKQFSEDLSALGKLNEINVRINSPGGNVFDGVAIYNTLRMNGARITVDIDGLAASIASIIAMVGNEVNMAANAFMMIHEARGFVGGNADEIRKQADLLEKVNGTLVDTYQRKTEMDADTIEAMMNDETWMTADEALQHGFIDSISDEIQMAAHFDMNKFKYKHPPEAMQNAAEVVKLDSTVKDTSARADLDYMNVRTAQLKQ